MADAQHVLVLDDSRPLPASAAVASIVSLPHPQSGTPTKFLWRDGALFEIQRAQSRDPRSWFIDNYVQHSGRLLMGTRMDPGFLLLYLLARAPPKLVALDQLLTEHVRAFPALRQLQPQLQRAAPRMADVDERLAPEHLLVRLNADKVQAWLAGKVRRVAAALAELEAQHSAAGAAAAAAVAPTFVEGAPAVRAAPVGSADADAGSSSSASAADEAPAPATAATARHVPAAVQLVADYLCDAWREALFAAHGLDAAGAQAGSSAAEEAGGDVDGEDAARKRKWGSASTSDDPDKVRQLLAGRSAATGVGTARGGGKAKPSPAQRKLEASSKGTRAISSFFQRK